MTTAVIMQPTYIPWMGYFNLISQADHFVFLDDVKIEKQSWHVRNKVLNQGEEHLITLPILGSRNQALNQVALDENQNWREKHSKLITHLYRKHEHGLDMLNTILPLINDKKIITLVNLNTSIIMSIAKKLEFKPVFHFSSNLNITAPRTQRLVSICHQLECNNYLSPMGSKEYIEQDGDFAPSAIDVVFQNFSPQPYPQKNVTPFVPYLSIIDMVANIGWADAARKTQ